MKAFLGAIIGAFLYLYVCNALDLAYRPFSDDLHAWVVLALPTGIALGAVTGYSISVRAGRNNFTPGIICILFGGLFGWVYFQCFRTTPSVYGLDYALAWTGPGMLWSCFLLLWGFFLVADEMMYNQKN